MEIKAVIFDMDGVITDTESLLVKYWCQAANEMGFPMEPKHAIEIRSLAGKYTEALSATASTTRLSAQDAWS